MSEPILKEAREKFIKSMNALFIAVDEEEAIDIRLSVFAYTNQLEQQSQRIEELEKDIEKQRGINNLLHEQLEQSALCSDHRDKFHGKRCRQCLVEELEGALRKIKKHDVASATRLGFCGEIAAKVLDKE